MVAALSAPYICERLCSSFLGVGDSCYSNPRAAPGTKAVLFPGNRSPHTAAFKWSHSPCLDTNVWSCAFLALEAIAAFLWPFKSSVWGGGAKTLFAADHRLHFRCVRGIRFLGLPVGSAVLWFLKSDLLVWLLLHLNILGLSNSRIKWQRKS